MKKPNDSVESFALVVEVIAHKVSDQSKHRV